MSANGLSGRSKNILGRDKAFELLEPFIAELDSAAHTGLEVYKELPAKYKKPLKMRSKKGVLNDHIVDAAIALLDGHNGVAVDDSHESTLFVFGAQLALRFKYVEQKYRTSNALSKRQRNINTQQLELDGFSRLTVVTYGYTLNAVWQDFLSTKIFCRSCNHTLWHIPISDFQQTKTLPLEASVLPPNEGPKVRSKRTTAKEG